MLTATAKQFADLELHGYLDGELGDQRIDVVEHYLDQEKDVAERLVHYGVQGDLIRRLYGPLINRPLPPQIASRCQFMNGKTSKTRSRGRKTRLFLLVLMILALGAVLWFFPAIIPQIVMSLKSLLSGVTGTFG